MPHRCVSRLRYSCCCSRFASRPLVLQVQTTNVVCAPRRDLLRASGESGRRISGTRCSPALSLVEHHAAFDLKWKPHRNEESLLLRDYTIFLHNEKDDDERKARTENDCWSRYGTTAVSDSTNSVNQLDMDEGEREIARSKRDKGQKDRESERERERCECWPSLDVDVTAPVNFLRRCQQRPEFPQENRRRRRRRSNGCNERSFAATKPPSRWLSTIPCPLNASLSLLQPATPNSSGYPVSENWTCSAIGTVIVTTF